MCVIGRIAFIKSPKPDSRQGDSTGAEIDMKLTTVRLNVLIDLIFTYVAQETILYY